MYVNICNTYSTVNVLDIQYASAAVLSPAQLLSASQLMEPASPPVQPDEGEGEREGGREEGREAYTHVHAYTFREKCTSITFLFSCCVCFHCSNSLA